MAEIPLSWQLSFVDLDLPYLPTKVKNKIKEKIKKYHQSTNFIEILNKNYQIPFKQNPDTLFVISGSFLLVGDFLRRGLLR